MEVGNELVNVNMHMATEYEHVISPHGADWSLLAHRLESTIMCSGVMDN